MRELRLTSQSFFKTMHWIDWVIIIIPLLIVAWISFYTRRFVTGVADFLAAGRVAGRYVVAVSSGEAAMGLISAVAVFELYYASGFAIGFWNGLVTPISLVLTLTGFCIYRYRETRAMTMGQFFEIRYSRKFRIFAGSLQALSGILNYGLFPAVGARFLVYFLDLPQRVHFLGWDWPTFALLMALFLTIAVVITTLGGQITVMTSDCVMGILSYPMYVAVVVSIFWGFSWWDEMAPALLDREPGYSMLNPFDTFNLRDFNLFYVFVGVISGIYGLMSWSGTQGYNAAAKTPHEQKMGRILGAWRSGFSGLMVIILAVAGYTYYNHANYKERAAATELHLAAKVLAETGAAYAPEGNSGLPLDAEEVAAWQQRVKEGDPAAHQTFETINKQMRVPVALREILPIGIVGMFCAVMIFLMISTDSTYIHSWGSIVVQDVVLPIRGRPFTPRSQLFWLRLVIVLVAVYAFFFSLYFGQVTYILMFFALTGSIYLGGAGSIILGGLYWKKGTAAGAWTAMITGSTLALAGFIFMNYWVGAIYPFLAQSPEFLAALTAAVEMISSPLEPIIVWRVTSEQFFMNGQEIYFLTMISSIAGYVGVSLLTCKEDFNMDRMLHRGPYRRADDTTIEKPALLAKGNVVWNVLKTLSGIDEQFTRGDKILSISVMIYSLGWGFGSFVVIVLWNILSPWPDSYWVNWFFISNIVVAALIGVVSTVWFSIGGTLDLRLMFRRLRIHRVSELDDGRVIGHMNADDAASKLGAIDPPIEEKPGKDSRNS